MLIKKTLIYESTFFTNFFKEKSYQAMLWSTISWLIALGGVTWCGWGKLTRGRRKSRGQNYLILQRLPRSRNTCGEKLRCNFFCFCAFCRSNRPFSTHQHLETHWPWLMLPPSPNTFFLTSISATVLTLIGVCVRENTPRPPKKGK